MKLYFLKGDKPFTKHYALDSKTSYPFVKNVTSFEAQCSTLEELAALLEAHGQQGHCLFKGQLTRALVDESRAGLYLRDAPTELVCFDLDGAPFATPDAFMQSIGLGDISYVLQWSASSGFKQGLCCHIFVLLAAPLMPAAAKLWLMELNYTNPVLRSALELTASGVALRYRLDVSTMQNDKIIYITKPSLAPEIEDPHPEARVSVVRRARDLFTLGPVPGAERIKEKTHETINQLRAAAGLEERKKFEYKILGTTEFLANPARATITGQRADRGFTYFNLNGGDSWGYYHPQNNPDFIFNFKGEPTYKTSELLPEYWRSLLQETAECKPNAQGETYIAFRDLNTSKYRSGLIKDDVLTLWPVDNERQLRQWMKEQGRPLGEIIPTYECYYDPTSSEILDLQAQKLNTFKPSPYFLGAVDPSISSCPPLCARLFRHALAADDALLHHWFNWVAGIVQLRRATTTAWVMQGIPGTGKGLTFNTLSLLLGEQNTTIKRLDELDSEFTGWVENSMLILADEMNADNIDHHSRLMARLKSLITEPVISVRRMYANAYKAKNFTNWIFASNMPNPIEVRPDDRRFNLGNFQTQRYVTSDAEQEQIKAELSNFYSFLMNWKLDMRALRTPLDTQSRRDLIEKNRVGADLVGEAIVAGDLQFFWDQMPDKPVKSWETSRITKYEERRAQFTELVHRLVTELPERLTRDEIQTLFMGCTDNVPETPTKFSRFANHHGVGLSRLRQGAQTMPGREVKWTYDPAWRAEALKVIKKPLAAVPKAG